LSVDIDLKAILLFTDVHSVQLVAHCKDMRDKVNSPTDRANWEHLVTGNVASFHTSFWTSIILGIGSITIPLA
jgi:hypothetical protein